MKLGSLVVEIAADSSKFVNGVADAEVKLSGLDKKARIAVNSIGAYGTAAAAAGVAASTYLVTSSLNAAKEISNLARVADTLPAEFQKMAFGAQQYGIAQDKLADILKDTKDRVGDFLSTGGGPMADFFENIAPKVGVTAEQFRKLSGRDAMQLYVDSLQKANLTQSEMTFYMEAMASDATALIPLLRDGGAALAEQADKAERLGLILSDIDVAQMEKASTAMDNMGTGIDALVNQVGAEFAPVISAISDEFFAAAEEAGGFGAIATDVFDSVINGASFVVDAADGIKRTFELTADGILIAINTAMAEVAKVVADVLDTVDSLPGVDFSETVRSINEFASTAENVVDEAWKNVDETLARPFAGEALRQFVEDAKVAGQAAAEAAVAARATASQEGGGVIPSAAAKQEQDALNAKIEAIRQANATEMELLTQRQAEEMEALQAFYSGKDELWAEHAELELETIARHEEEKSEIEQKAADLRKRQADEEARYKQQAMAKALSNLTTLMNSSSREMFEIGKVAALSQAVIDGYAAITGAYKVGASIGGPGLGAAYGAAAALATANQINAIRGQSFGGGGGGAAGGSVTGNVNAQSEPVRTQAAQPTQTMMVSGISEGELFTGDRVRSIVGELLEYQRNGGTVILE